MATPLRKDQPQFEEDEGLTTADLAQGLRPVTEPRGPQAVGAERFEQTSAMSTRLEPGSVAAERGFQTDGEGRKRRTTVSQR